MKNTAAITAVSIIIAGYALYKNGVNRTTLIPILFIIATLSAIVYIKRKKKQKFSDTPETNIPLLFAWIAFFSSITVAFPDALDYIVYNKITVEKIIIAILSFIITYVISKTVTTKVSLNEKHDKAIIIKMRILHYTIVFTAFLIILKYLGLSTAFTNILLAGSITSIIIGLAAQKTIGNFIAGIILLMDKPFKIGDYIEVQGVNGFVVDIQFMSTIIKTLDEKTIRIPNEVIITERVTNYKKNKIIRITQQIGISYDSDIEKAKKAILEVLEDHEFVLAYPQPFVGVDSYGDSSINITFWYYVPFDEWITTSREVLETIKKKFDEYGVVIPYPQLVIHGGSPIKIDEVFIGKNQK